MKTFISASGGRGRAIARELAGLLSGLKTPLEPWFHETDIPKGVLWAQDLWQQLQDPQLGLVVVTRESVKAPWLLFEAGMLAQNLGNARVFTLLLDVEDEDVGEPLSHFQSTRLLDDRDMYALAKALNQCCDDPVDEGALRKAFKRAWPAFSSAVDKIPTEDEREAHVDPGRLLETVLDKVESIERSTGARAIEQLDYNEGSSRLSDKKLRREIITLLDDLPANERRVLAYYYREHLSLREIGEIMGVSESRVSQLFTKGIVRVRGMIKDDGYSQ